jgi:hypothetical protein
MKSFVIIVLILSVFIFATVFADKDDKTTKSAKKSSSGKKAEKDWNKINMQDLDKEWEQGDASEELEDELEKNRRIQQSKQPKLDINDGEGIQRAYKADPFAFSGGGGQMVFVDLREKQPSGKAWTKPEVDALCKKFATMLKSGSIPANVYNIDIERILVHIEKPWQVKDMLTFLSQQREVKQFTANSKTYTTAEWKAQFAKHDDEYDDDDEF